MATTIKEKAPIEGPKKRLFFLKTVVKLFL